MLRFTKSPYAAPDDQALMTELWDPKLAEDLEAFVLYAFPWGKPNTPLESRQIRSWQRDELQKITEVIRNNRARMANGQDPVPDQSATVSGRGVGKSTLVAWLTLWNMTCNVGSSTIVTANTEAQLLSKTWPELGNWYTYLINKHWFELAGLSLKPAPWFERGVAEDLQINPKYYFAQATLWSEENPDAFAGHHNMYGTLLVFDEASGIPKPIWDVSEGYFTEPVLHRYWQVFSNGRRNEGPFFECFHKFRQFWRRRQLDSRTVEGTDKGVLQKIIDKYGIDSDTARIEVRGMFPQAGSDQFIARDLVVDATTRELVKDPWSPVIMGVDPARFGDDEMVVRFRQGRDARSFPVLVWKGLDTTQQIARTAEWIEKVNPDGVCIDSGAGGGLIDGLRALKFVVHEIAFGGKSTNPRYANKRTEMWAELRDWLPTGCIDDHDDLCSDLPGPKYYFPGTSDVIGLEPKKAMKERGLASPNHGDALALTFAKRFPHKAVNAARKMVSGLRQRVAKGMDYDLFGG